MSPVDLLRHTIIAQGLPPLLERPSHSPNQRMVDFRVGLYDRAPYDSYAQGDDHSLALELRSDVFMYPVLIALQVWREREYATAGVTAGDVGCMEGIGPVSRLDSVSAGICIG